MWSIEEYNQVANELETALERLRRAVLAHPLPVAVKYATEKAIIQTRAALQECYQNRPAQS